MRRPSSAWILLAALAATACRDGLEPFELKPLDRDTTGSIRMTFSAGEDLYPGWSRDGRSVVYAGSGYAGLAPGRGLILSIPRSGGAAALVFPDLQGPGAGGPRWLAGPAVRPEDSAVAYIQLAAVAVPTPSDTLSCRVPEPVLDSAVIRVRRPGETRSILADPARSIRFAGREPGMLSGGTGPFTTRLYPFQRQFLDSGILAAGPSWSPDGQLAFSDGVQLFVWAADESPARRVPGTDDAVSPAWSPDGQWLVYARLERGDSTVETCTVVRGSNAIVQHTRIGYEWTRSTIVRVRPDGTGSMDLTEGTDPAWSPDGAWIYFHARGRIERIPAGGGAPQAIPGTEAGRWPAVPADGGRLAFMRREGDESWDVWTVPLSR